MFSFDTVVTVLTMLGEWGIVVVIYWELESNRLDRFLEAAFTADHFDARRKIYEAYFEVEPDPGTPRNVAFCQFLMRDAEIKHLCDRELSLLQRIGSNLPLLPPFRRKALQWFPVSVVMLWEILSPYIEQRRANSIPFWAGYFVRFALASLKEIEREGRSKVVFKDPDQKRAADIILEKEDLARIRAELERAAYPKCK